ncbi:MAG TPA: hypothetical protein VFB96_04130 [Pirellulaceae bacterium]|nr:hypothetical protein [Pirellulaceae bacterium]
MLFFGRLIQRTWLLYFSKPASDRSLYRALSGKPIRTVVEIGLPDLARTRRLWDALAWRKDSLPLRYTGIDLFESRPKDQAALPLKQAFAELRRDQVQVKLVPGDAQTALYRTANSLTGTDLLLISRNLDGNALARAWTWMPRMLHAGTIIFQEVTDSQGGRMWQRLSIVDIQKRAAATKGSGKGKKAA